MKVFIDTNIILDVLLDMEPFSEDAAELLSLCESGSCIGVVSVLTVCNLIYILRKFIGASRAETEVMRLLGFLEPIGASAADIKSVFASEHSDFEDAVQLQCARTSHADVIATRDKSGFSASEIPAMTAGEILSA